MKWFAKVPTADSLTVVKRVNNHDTDKLKQWEYYKQRITLNLTTAKVLPVFLAN